MAFSYKPIFAASIALNILLGYGIYQQNQTRVYLHLKEIEASNVEYEKYLERARAAYLQEFPNATALALEGLIRMDFETPETSFTSDNGYEVVATPGAGSSYRDTQVIVKRDSTSTSFWFSVNPNDIPVDVRFFKQTNGESSVAFEMRYQPSGVAFLTPQSSSMHELQLTAISLDPNSRVIAGLTDAEQGIRELLLYYSTEVVPKYSQYN